MSGEEQLWVINLGVAKEKKGFREVVIYQYRLDDGRRIVPVFTTTERLAEYIEKLKNSVNAHMDLLERSPNLDDARTLTEGRFTGLLLSTRTIANMLPQMGANAILKDPDPDSHL